MFSSQQLCILYRVMSFQSSGIGIHSSLWPGAAKHKRSPIPIRPVHSKFPRICGSSGEAVVHNIYNFSINRPVLSCLFLYTSKRTQDIRLSPHPHSPRSDGSLLWLSSRSFPPPGSPLPITYLNLWRLGMKAPGENL